jgi:hypothetical protein
MSVVGLIGQGFRGECEQMTGRVINAPISGAAPLNVSNDGLPKYVVARRILTQYQPLYETETLDDAINWAHKQNSFLKMFHTYYHIFHVTSDGQQYIGQYK